MQTLSMLLIVAATFVLLIVSIVLQLVVQDRSWYAAFQATASRIGWVVLIVAVAVFLADLAAMAVYTIRRGTPDNDGGDVVSEHGPIPMSLNRVYGRAKYKVLAHRHRHITTRSLVDGTATRSERLMVVGIVTAMTSFFLIFVGAALMLMARLLFGAFLIIIPAIWLFRFGTTTWRSYRRAKREVA